MGGNGALRVHHVFSADLAVAADVLAQREVVEVEGQIDEILLGRVLQLCDADEELIILVIIETLHPLGEVVQFVQICEAVFQNGEFSFSAVIWAVPAVAHFCRVLKTVKHHYAASLGKESWDGCHHPF